MNGDAHEKSARTNAVYGTPAITGDARDANISNCSGLVDARVINTHPRSSYAGTGYTNIARGSRLVDTGIINTHPGSTNPYSGGHGRTYDTTFRIAYTRTINNRAR